MKEKVINNTISEINCETLPVDEVMERFNTGRDGLSEKTANELLLKYGKNKLPEVKRKHAIIRLLSQFHNVLIYVLLGAAALTAVMAIATGSREYWIDTSVILGVVIVNTIIGFIQESKAQKALDSIKNLLSLKAVAVRDGVRREVSAEDIVIGDVVYLKSGDKVPADIRLISVSRFEVDESALTGESLAVTKITNAVKAGTVLGERECMVYAGTNIRTGDALGIVIGTAGDTQIGKINQMLTETKSETTPLMKKMNKFGKVLALLILSVSAIMIPISVFAHGMPWEDALLAVIGVAVAAIPEGLPSIVIVILAMGVKRMARKKAIVKKLPSVETLGSVTVICSDKTGTLTKNEMTATNIYTAFGDFEVTGSGYAPDGFITLGGREFDTTHPSLKRLLRSADLCNESGVSEQNGVWIPQGAPTEAALKVLAQKGKLPQLDAKKLASIPFDSEHKYMAVLTKVGAKTIVFVNGAPEKVLELCKSQKNGEKEEKIDHKFWDDKMTKSASGGKRMIGIAYANVDEATIDLEHGDLENINLVFLGFVGIIDPPKPDAVEAIKVARNAGIRVKMITGDHVLTAQEIARQMGLTDNPNVISGAELEQMDDDQIRKAALECDVFARTSPEHKLRLVKALQESGEIVSMTGDGVNDAPALKKADIGVAMGIKGTEVTKDSSEMVLADDNFATIVSAVSEGRTIYDNLKKTLIFILPTNGAQAFSIIFAMLIGFTLPISALQILWVNMVVAVTLAISLSFEPPEVNIMSREPRNPKEPLIDKYILFRTIFASIIFTILTFGAFAIFYNVIDLGVDSTVRLTHARTLAVNMLVGASLFYLLNCKRMTGSLFSKDFFKNKVVLIVVGILIALQISFTYIPFMQSLFSTSALRVVDWLIVISGGIFALAIVEIEKLITRQIQKRRSLKL